MKLYIGNIPDSISESELTVFFAEFGEVTSLIFVKDKVTNRSMGYGFVEMPDIGAAQRAVWELNGMNVNGHEIRINEHEIQINESTD